MILIKKKSILARLLEKGVEIFIRKKCKKIKKININIIASTNQIFKGIIDHVNLIAEEVNYQDLVFDKIELEASEVKFKLKINKKDLEIKNNLIINFKLSLSEKSIKKILFSKHWNWIQAIISKNILDEEKLEDIKIKGEQMELKSIRNKHIRIEKVNFILKNGNLYLASKNNKKSIIIPIEDKVDINNIYIKNDSINILANSSVSF